MKLEKLFKLSRFVDLIQSQIHPVQYESEDHSCSWAIDRIWYYNAFLKQPLTKEMFINPFEKPDIDNYTHNGKVTGTYSILLCKWQEAEKKVIFDSCKKSHYYAFNYIINDYRINFENADFIQLEHTLKPIKIIVKTLSDLAEATNGLLTLKNVTI